MGRSMFDPLGAGETIEFTITYDGFPEVEQSRLRASWDVGDSTVRFVRFRPGPLPLPEKAAVPEPEDAHLDVAPCVAADCGHVHFLATDTIVLSDLARLWRLPLGATSRPPHATRSSPPCPIRTAGPAGGGWVSRGR